MARSPQDPVVNTLQKDGKPVTREKVSVESAPVPAEAGSFRRRPVQDRDGGRPAVSTLAASRSPAAYLSRQRPAFPSSAQPLGGWEAPDCELRGHYAGGHYLSACALMYASSGDEDLKNNANTVVAELGKCQAALKSGYLSAFPVEFFDRLRERQQVWAPFYTIHKIMAGLLDMYVYCGNEQALEMVAENGRMDRRSTRSRSATNTCSACLALSLAAWARCSANLYAVTGKQEYLEVAQRFDKKQFFDPLAAHRDELKGLHVNTHMPQVIAAARYYELTGERRYRDIAEYFWDEVVSERSYCTGGTSNGESWNTDPGQALDRTGTRHDRVLLRLQHDEADAAFVRLVARRSSHGLLRAHALQSSPRHHQSRRRHDDVLPAACFGILENFRQASSMRSGAARVPAPRSTRS